MDARIQKMAHTIINYSTEVKPGERVLIRSTSPAGEPLCQALYSEALKAGALASVYIHMSQEDPLALEATSTGSQLSAVNPMLKLMYDEAEVIIRIEAQENSSDRASYPLAAQIARAKSHSALIDVQMIREANKTLRRCTTQFPTLSYAQNAGMSLIQYENFLFNACKVNLDDPVAAWSKMYAEQERLVEWLKGKKFLQIHGDHIDMEMSIDGRLFMNAGGKANFPDGEIHTGPVETSVNGWIRFTYPAYYRGNEVKGVELKFLDGRVVEAHAETNQDFLIATLDTDPGARYLGEFAIGNNRDIQEFTGSILFDEKIGGTVHMAVGQGYRETGSVNNSSVHWDMICDMRTGGEILVDGELFYKGGEFVV
ncbi:MAG: aminopeptidase [Chloroflexi bacterium]|nr:MAG: aminopeptidase [Chloroflexota bacterium]